MQFQRISSMFSSVSDWCGKKKQKTKKKRRNRTSKAEGRCIHKRHSLDRFCACAEISQTAWGIPYGGLFTAITLSYFTPSIHTRACEQSSQESLKNSE